MDNKLKPCPFCGKAPEESERADKNTCTGRAYFVACMCGGYSANAHQFGETKEEVVSKWNRRAYAEQLERERDALRRDNLELKRVYDERGKQIERLDTALARAKSPQPVGAVVAGYQFTRAEGRGWYVDPQKGDRWIAYDGTPAGDLVAALAAQTPAQQSGWKMMPVEATKEIISAMMTSKAIDDEGEFPLLMDHIDYSGENKTRCVVKAAYAAAIAAAPSPEAQGDK